MSKLKNLPRKEILSKDDSKSASGGFSLSLAKRRVQLLRSTSTSVKPSLTNVAICSGCHGCTGADLRSVNIGYVSKY